MENKINIAELLKYCPKGMELDCASYDNVSFDKISDDKKATYPIFCYITDKEGNRSSISFTENGCESKRYGAKCVIFPKGKTTWEGFTPPCKFKDGDILYVESNKQNKYIIIFEEIKNNYIYYHICFGYQNLSINEILCHLVDVEIIRLATEEEKQKLFDAIKDNGYKWNQETKTLEKLVEPKFKVGDRIKHKRGYFGVSILKINTDCYTAKDFTENQVTIDFTHQDDYELVPNKFDITTLKPFDKVLVRDEKHHVWFNSFFGVYRKDSNAPFVCCNGFEYKYCIPYESNQHLLGTTNDCDDFYKTWEK